MHEWQRQCTCRHRHAAKAIINFCAFSLSFCRATREIYVHVRFVYYARMDVYICAVEHETLHDIGARLSTASRLLHCHKLNCLFFRSRAPKLITAISIDHENYTQSFVFRTIWVVLIACVCHSDPRTLILEENFTHLNWSHCANRWCGGAVTFAWISHLPIFKEWKCKWNLLWVEPVPLILTSCPLNVYNRKRFAKKHINFGIGSNLLRHKHTAEWLMRVEPAICRQNAQTMWDLFDTVAFAVALIHFSAANR